jgi:hypothetical protein
MTTADIRLKTKGAYKKYLPLVVSSKLTRLFSDVGFFLLILSSFILYALYRQSSDINYITAILTLLTLSAVIKVLGESVIPSLNSELKTLLLKVYQHTDTQWSFGSGIVSFCSKEEALKQFDLELNRILTSYSSSTFNYLVATAVAIAVVFISFT